jgi:ketosteroid isomerase-like protein
MKLLLNERDHSGYLDYIDRMTDGIILVPLRGASIDGKAPFMAFFIQRASTWSN